MRLQPGGEERRVRHELLTAERRCGVRLEPRRRREPVQARLFSAPLRPLVASEGRGDRDDGEYRDLEDLDDLLPGLLRRSLAHAYPGNTLIARAMTRMAVINEITDSTIIVIFAQTRTGSVSVGLKAVALVKDRKR